MKPSKGDVYWPVLLVVASVVGVAVYLLARFA